jgi:amino acid transporter
VLIGALGRRSASPGSLYSYATDSLPPVFASIAAWGLLLGYVATGSAVAAGFALYTNFLLKALVGHQSLSSLLILLCVLGGAAMAYRDVKLSAQAMLWLEALSVVSIAIVFVLILWKNGLHLDWPQWRLQGSSIPSIRLGLVLAIFSFVGFESATWAPARSLSLRHIPRCWGSAAPA